MSYAGLTDEDYDHHKHSCRYCGQKNDQINTLIALRNELQLRIEELEEKVADLNKYGPEDPD